MPKFSNHLEVYKLLPKTNCRDCGLGSCLALAVGVMQGQKSLEACPHLPPEVASQGGGAGGSGGGAGVEEMQRTVDGLREQVRGLDLAATAKRLGAELRQGRLIVPCLGKEFSLGPQGDIISSCHINLWVSLPILSYALHSDGLEPQGQWVTLRDLPGGLDWWRFFSHRCEAPLKKVIDEHTSLFELIVDIFDGQPAPEQFDSDIAVLIHPLPKLPMLICYWKPEDGMASSLNLFFDATAARNLGVESIYMLCTGVVIMFEKVALTHDR